MTMDLASIIKARAVKFSTPQRTYKNSAGKRMTWILDLRPILLDAACLELIAGRFWDIYGGRPIQIAGLEMAGVPLATAIALEGRKRGFDVAALIVRVKRKKHMGAEIIEGEPNNNPVVLVDDSVNSGRNAELARQKLEAAGLTVASLFTLVDFRSVAGVEWRTRHNVAVISLLRLADLGLTYANPHTPKTAFAVAWSFAAPRPKLDFAVAKSTPVLFEDRVIFGTDGGTLWGVERLTGRIEWQMSIPDKTGKGIVSSPALHEGRVYVGGYDGTLYCLDARTGKRIWANPCCSWIGSSPAIDGDRLYIGLEYADSVKGGAVAAFDLDGKLLWRKFTTKQLHSSPIVHEGHVLTGTNDCDLWALTRDGELVSAVKTKGPTKYHVAAKGDLAVACAFDALYVWNWRTGEVLLRHETSDINYSRPLIVGDRAFCGSADGNLYAIDLSPVPHVASILSVGEKIHSSPALIDGAVWFGTSAGELLAVSPVDLDVLKRWAFPERLTCTPVSDGVLMYVHAYDNRMWAVKGIL